MSGAARILAVLAPLLGLGAAWGLSDHTYRQGTEWDVPIQGYDPRDVLRGHYVEFTYDWPGLGDRFGQYDTMLCLEGDAPVLARVRSGEAARPCAHPLRADPGGVYGVDALWRGRLYLDQDRAFAIDRQLRDQEQRGIVTIRQREDGSFTPVAIRFRPLTAAERAAREAEREAQLRDQRPPPAIIVQ